MQSAAECSVPVQLDGLTVAKHRVTINLTRDEYEALFSSVRNKQSRPRLTGTPSDY